MSYKDRSINKGIKDRYDLSKDNLYLIILFIFNLFINNNIQLKMMYFDDYFTWNAFCQSTGFFNYIFSTDGNKFRPIYYALQYGLFELLGENIMLYKHFNVIFLTIISFVIYNIAKQITKNKFISFMISNLFVLSRFSYYSISLVLGTLESLALLWAILALYFMWKYLIQEIDYKKNYYISILFCGLAMFTHERYMTLSMLGVFVILLKNILPKKIFIKENIKLIILTIIPLLVNILYKQIFIGGHILEGSGGVPIGNSFDIVQIIKFFISGCLYMLGVNAGPAYLNGINYKDVPLYIQLINLSSILCLLIILGIYIRRFIKSKYLNRRQELQVLLLFLGFIGILILSASVTIRVEMRWLYTPYVGFLILIGYVSGILIENNRIYAKKCYIIMIIFFILTISRELFYRENYSNLYYWKKQVLHNKLYEKTLESYGNNILDRQLILIGGEEAFPDSKYLEDIFKQFNNGKPLDIRFLKVDNIYQLNAQEIEESCIILKVQGDEISDITEVFNEIKKSSSIGKSIRDTILLDGWYSWEAEEQYIWTSKKASTYIKSGGNGRLYFEGSTAEFNVPNKIQILINDKYLKEIDIQSTNISFEVDIPKNEIMKITLELEKAKSPVSVGASQDQRELGLCVSNMWTE